MNVVLLLLVSMTTPVPETGRADAGDTLTVVSLNIWHDQGDWPRRLSKIVAGLRALDPDVICLQEVLQHATLPNQATTLAESLGCRAHFTTVDPEGSPKRYGNAILTRHPILHAGGKSLDPKDDYRTVAHVRIDFHGRPLDVYDTHLHHTLEGDTIRAIQIRDLLAFIDSTRGGGALVLAGDFNAELDRPEMRPVTRSFTDAYVATHPGARAEDAVTLNEALGNAPRCIDHIFTARRGGTTLAPRSAEVILRDRGPDGVWASDHFGVVARFVAGGRPVRH